MWDIATKERLIQPNKTDIHSLSLHKLKSPRPNKEGSAYIHKNVTMRVRKGPTEGCVNVQQQANQFNTRESRQQLFV